MRKLYIDGMLALTLITLLIIVSCKVSKDVAPPDMNLPATYGSASADSATIGALGWSVFFDDHELQKLIARALDQNYDLQVAMKNIETAEMIFRQARLGNIPSVRLQTTVTTSRPSDNSLNGFSLNQFLGQKRIEDYTLAPAISWETGIWGKIKSQTRAAQARYLLTQEAHKAIRTKIVSEISTAYYNLLMLHAQLNITKKNLCLNDSTLAIVRLQYEAGQVTTLAVQQAAAQLLATAGLVPQFEKQIAIQENGINVLSGQLPEELKINGDLDALVIESEFATGIPAALLSLRPDVRQAEVALDVANANVGYAKAIMYPSLTISAQGGLNAIKASDWFNVPASLFGVVSGSIVQPLFDKRRLKTLYNVAKVDRDAAVITFRKTVVEAFGEVSDALIDISKLKEQHELLTGRVDTLEIAVTNSRMLFNNGLASYLEVVIAQENVLQSELELAYIKKERLVAGVTLYRSLGGGWK